MTDDKRDTKRGPALRLDDCGDTLTKRELCAVLQISPATLNKLRKTGDAPEPLPLPGYVLRWSKEQVRRFLAHDPAGHARLAAAVLARAQGLEPCSTRGNGSRDLDGGRVARRSTGRRGRPAQRVLQTTAASQEKQTWKEGGPWPLPSSTVIDSASAPRLGTPTI